VILVSTCCAPARSQTAPVASGRRVPPPQGRSTKTSSNSEAKEIRSTGGEPPLPCVSPPAAVRAPPDAFTPPELPIPPELSAPPELNAPPELSAPPDAD